MKTIYLFFSFFVLLSCSSQDDDIFSDIPFTQNEPANIMDINEFNDQNIEKNSETLIFSESDLPDKKYSRGPVVAISNNGNILAACQKMQIHSDKEGETDILLALSADGGKTYQKTVLFKNDPKYGRLFNASFVIDRTGAHGKKGRIYCFVFSIAPSKLSYEVNKGESTTLYKYSDDNGITWSNMLILKTPDQCPIFGPSPANGVQLENGTLVIPAFITLKDHSLRTGIIFKVPSSNNWEFNIIDTKQSKNDNESTILKYGDGNQVFINVRNSVATKTRHTYYSNAINDRIKGNKIEWNKHFSDSRFQFLGACHGGLESIMTNTNDAVFLFSQPLEKYTEGLATRGRICIWKSSDLMQWTASYLLTTTESAGYSNLTFYDNKLLAIYESDYQTFKCSIQDLTPLLPFLMGK